MTPIFKSVSVTIACLLAGAVQADEIGEAEYMNACASCHGEGGAGDGPLADDRGGAVADGAERGQ